MSTIRVAVCGLTSSMKNSHGSGKSCLCNRLVQPTHDELHMDHTSVLNLSEFGSSIINNTHFLYWGEKVTVLEDGQQIKFQIVEHTEFVDDSSLKPFPASKPYHKRCIQIKLRSSGKETYLEPNQLALPEHYTDAPTFPDKFFVDGFIMCVDVSTIFEHPSDFQRKFLDQLLVALLATRKPVVIACTKFDRAKAASVASVAELVARSKKQVPIVEVSALKGVNVDMCFLVMAHLVDQRKPKIRIVSYAESKTELEERIQRNEEAFQYVLDERVVDFSMSLEDANKHLEATAEYQVLVDLCGQERVKQLIQAKIKDLVLQVVKSKADDFAELLEPILVAMLPVLEPEVTVEDAKTKLRGSVKYSKYFVDVENWKENVMFLKSIQVDSAIVPFGILEEEQGLDVLRNHINEMLARAAIKKMKDILHHTTDTLPGVDMTMLWIDLGLTDESKRVSMEKQMLIYNEYMAKLEKECVADLMELFLERLDLFDQISPSPMDIFDHVHKELKDNPCYKRLDHRSQLRMSQALKHIGSLQIPEKSPAFSKSGLQDSIKTLQATGVLSREMLKPASQQAEGALWELSTEGSCLHLCLLGRTEDNTKTLRSDFMNHFSCLGEVEIDGHTYQIDMSLQHGHDIHSLNTDSFLPHGAVAIVNSLECIDWLRDVVERLWLFVEVGGEKEKHAPYRGMPLIILALDKYAEGSSKVSSRIHTGAQALAGEVQCVCIAETSSAQPMRLVGFSIIHQILLSLVNAFSHLDTFFKSDLQLKDPMGFNIAVCTLVDDPYPNEALLNPLLQHQLVCCQNTDQTLFLKCAIEKQHHICVFTFNSMLNVPVLCSSTHLGFILVYSTQRRASLAVLKYLLPKLPNIPKLIVAMTTSQSHDETLLVEGQEAADIWKATLISNNGQELPAGFAVEFLHRCWFCRFTSWQAQNLSDDRLTELRDKRLARALPDKPTFTPLSLLHPQHSTEHQEEMLFPEQKDLSKVSSGDFLPNDFPLTLVNSPRTIVEGEEERQWTAPAGTSQRKGTPVDNALGRYVHLPPRSDGYDPAAAAAAASIPSTCDVYSTLYEREREGFQDEEAESIYSSLQESPDEQGTFPDDCPDESPGFIYENADESIYENPDESIYENPENELESASDQESLYAEVNCEPKNLRCSPPKKHSSNAHDKPHPPITYSSSMAGSSSDVKTNRNISYERHSLYQTTV